MRANIRLLSGATAALAWGCAPNVGPMPEPLPPLPVVEVVRAPVAQDSGRAVLPAEERITMTAANAPLREILPLIAEAAGLTLVVDPAVTGRVTFHFEDVPAQEALRQLAEQSGFTLGTGASGIELPYRPRTVFFRPAVNIDALGVRAIQERFGVGFELAEWIVLSRAAKQ